MPKLKRMDCRDIIEPCRKNDENGGKRMSSLNFGELDKSTYEAQSVIEIYCKLKLSMVIFNRTTTFDHIHKCFQPQV
jgi:hypothetical protein